MMTHTVTSGSFMISRKKPGIMRAFLGSCTGVSLFDRKAGIGGLIHLLLPEPPSMDPAWNPGVSATIGMPVFIDELCRQGAAKDRLEACIAGGALIDPVSETDLTLDIGGRTTEIVQNILQKERIPIRQIEIGGFLSTCISLNLETWETTIEPFTIPAAATQADSNYTLPSAEQINEVIEQLFPIPQIALKIIRMINDGTPSFREISQEVLKDQVLSARIIRMCNSVPIKPAFKVDSIDKALLRIGEKKLMLLALCFSMENFISQARRGYSLCMGGLFHHSVCTARICCHLAELTRKAYPDLAYTAGLLHDIGKVVLDQFMHSAYPLFYRQLQIQGSDLLAVEKLLFGVAHTEAGYLLACRWSMPEFVRDIILHHHEPNEAAEDPALAHMVYVADLMSSRFVLGHYVNTADSSHLRTSIKLLDLDIANLPMLLADAPFTPFEISG
ncbi:MAG TPA: HDOD domain-containing protein [Syntrophobacteraceae bacterium]|nr:HDOD domain-containing protein [Syntrophobacteraceae bacterium]